MARPYSFKQEKQHLTQAGRGEGSSSPIHYGNRFGKTQELLAVKAMNQELERLAGISEPTAPRDTPKSASPAFSTAVGNPVPIGALPAPEELPEASALASLVDMASRQVQTAQSAVVDLRRAGARLLRLPLDAARLLAHRFRLLDAQRSWS